MRIQVIINSKGAVIGGMRVEPLQIEGRPFQMSLVPERGQEGQELDVPDDAQYLEDPGKLLVEIAKLLSRQKKRKR